MPRRMSPPPPSFPADPRPSVDLNQIVAYNVRAARELRGWTQEDLAGHLERYWGQRLTQAGVSAIERGWDGEKRREFDAHELLIFAMVFNLPVIWFLLPPKGDHRLLRGTTRQVDELYIWLLGRPDQAEPVYARLREWGIHDPQRAELVVEALTGRPAQSRAYSYKERRKEMLLALMDDHADNFDQAIDEIGRWVDKLRLTGLRGFIAEHTDDPPPPLEPEPWDIDYHESGPDDTASDGTEDHTTSDDSGKARPARGLRRRRPPS